MEALLFAYNEIVSPKVKTGNEISRSWVHLYNNDQLNLFELSTPFVGSFVIFVTIFFCFLSLVTTLLLTQFSIIKM